MIEISDQDKFNADQVIIDLLASFLAINGVSVATGFSIAKRLFESQIVCIDKDSNSIRFTDEHEIFSAIVGSSYPRGHYVSRLVASRVFRSFSQINSQGGLAFLCSLTEASVSDVRSKLLPLYGVGEKFVSTYSLLAGIMEY